MALIVTLAVNLAVKSFVTSAQITATLGHSSEKPGRAAGRDKSNMVKAKSRGISRHSLLMFIKATV